MAYYKGFIGSYTRRKSSGIRSFRFNEDEFITEDFFTVDDPTYLLLDKDEHILYSSIREGNEGGIMSLNLDTLYADKVTFENNATPCHISKFSDFILASNYHQGYLDLYLTENNEVQERLQSIEFHDTGPVIERQAGSHVHFAEKNPYNDDILVCDLGADKVYIFTNGNELNQKGEILLPPGSGPRHFVFHGKEKILYVFSEISSELFTFNFKDGSYLLKQAVKTLPEDFKGENTGSDIRITSDNRFIYVSNRGHDSISVFSIKENGLLELVEIVSTEGEHPRDFNLSPDGEFLLAGNMNTDNLTLHKVNRDTGSLKVLRNDIYSPEPTSIVFQR